MLSIEKKMEIDTCGVLKVYFYDNLFDPKYYSTIISHVNLNKN